MARRDAEARGAELEPALVASLDDLAGSAARHIGSKFQQLCGDNEEASEPRALAEVLAARFAEVLADDAKEVRKKGSSPKGAWRKFVASVTNQHKGRRKSVSNPIAPIRSATFFQHIGGSQGRPGSEWAPAKVSILQDEQTVSLEVVPQDKEPERFPIDLVSSISEAPKSLVENGFQVEILGKSLIFSCKSNSEALDWIAVLRDASHNSNFCSEANVQMIKLLRTQMPVEGSDKDKDPQDDKERTQEMLDRIKKLEAEVVSKNADIAERDRLVRNLQRALRANQVLATSGDGEAESNRGDGPSPEFGLSPSSARHHSSKPKRTSSKDREKARLRQKQIEERERSVKFGQESQAIEDAEREARERGLTRILMLQQDTSPPPSTIGGHSESAMPLNPPSIEYVSFSSAPTEERRATNVCGSAASRSPDLFLQRPSASAHIPDALEEVHNSIYPSELRDPWFHGMISRGEASRRVNATGPLGTGLFLVRESESKLGQYVLSVNSRGSSRLVRVAIVDNSVHAGPHAFSSFDEMFVYFKSHPCPESSKSESSGKESDNATLFLTTFVPSDSEERARQIAEIFRRDSTPSSAMTPVSLVSSSSSSVSTKISHPTPVHVHPSPFQSESFSIL